MKTIVKNKADLDKYQQIILVFKSTDMIKGIFTKIKAGYQSIHGVIFTDIEGITISYPIGVHTYKAILPNSDKLVDITDLICTNNEDTISIEEADISKGIIAFNQDGSIYGYVVEGRHNNRVACLVTTNERVNYYISVKDLINSYINLVFKQLQ